MTWEWSHTEDAYAYAQEQLDKLERDRLLDIVECWNDYFAGEADDAVELALDNPRDLTNDTLREWIWEQASHWEHGRNCSSGGHELYLDHDGYHTVDLGKMPADWTPSEY